MTVNDGIDVGANSAAHLKSFVERIERLEEEKAGIGADIKEVYAEAKGTGFDTKIIREVIKRRKMEAYLRDEFDDLVDLYERALGGYADTPLGQANRPRRAGEAPSDAPPPPAGKKKSKAIPEPTVDEALQEKTRLAKMTPKEAEALGQKAHADKLPITANPFAPKSKQRAGWDKGWCAADESDGMRPPGDDGVADASDTDDGVADDGEG